MFTNLTFVDFNITTNYTYNEVMTMPKDVLKHAWIMRMSMAMRATHPDVPAAQIDQMVAQIYAARVKDTKVQMYNNYENIVAGTTLLDMVDWMQTAKPLIAESGVFFYQKSQKRNVNTEIIKECMLDARNVHKAEMFTALDAKDVFLAATKDLQQSNDKKAANSGYGAEGESSSFLYNIHSAMSVTACGRGQISTACQCFENLLADSVKFFHMTEFFTWVYNIINERVDWKFDTFKICPKVPSRKAFIRRFERKFGHSDLCNIDMLGQTYDYLDDEMRARVYYKANFREFIALPIPCELYGDIICTDVEFINPNKPPAEIKPMLTKLTEMVLEFVGYKHGVFRYEDRTRYQKRAICIVIDTDSNFLYYGDLLRYLMGGVLPQKMFRKKADRQAYKNRILNVLSDISTKAITERLFNYLGVVNVPEEDRHWVNMKNEFYYTRVIVTYAKKSYVGLQKRKENVIFDTPELDVKGVNFFKSTASEETTQFIYDEVLMKQLLDPPSGEVSLRSTYRAISDFQMQMADKIRSGNMGYLKRSIRVKTPDAYANPMGIGQYKAVYAWNAVVPDRERITLPNTVTIVKVLLRSKKDVAALEKWPEIYDNMMRLFDTDPEIGDYVDKTTGKVKKGKGIKSIALPSDLDEVPDWVLAIIDTETLVSDNMKLFTQLFRPLGMTKGTTTHNGSSMAYYTNIIRI